MKPTRANLNLLVVCVFISLSAHCTAQNFISATETLSYTRDDQEGIFYPLPTTTFTPNATYPFGYGVSSFNGTGGGTTACNVNGVIRADCFTTSGIIQTSQTSFANVSFSANLQFSFGLNQAYSYTVTADQTAYSATVTPQFSLGGGNLAPGAHFVSAQASKDQVSANFQLHLSPISDAQLKDAQYRALLNAIPTPMLLLDTRRIDIFFDPQALALAQAAALFPNVDHFNWTQTATYPSQDHIWIVDDKTGLRLPVGNTIVDPTPISGTHYEMTRDGLDSVARTNVPGLFPPDGSGFYYSETKLPFSALSEVQSHTGALGLRLTDSPSAAYWLLGKDSLGNSLVPGDDEYVQFESKLVGVTADGQPVDLSEMPGTTILWKSNTVTDGSINVGGNIYDVIVQGDDVNPFSILSGGIYDVQVVPEPESAILLAVGAIFMLFIRHFRIFPIAHAKIS